MDGYRILNFRNFQMRIGYGYSNFFSDMDQESKNQYPLTFGTVHLCMACQNETPNASVPLLGNVSFDWEFQNLGKI